MPAPHQHNLHEVAHRILYEDCRAVQLGDSTGTNTNTPRWGESIISYLTPTRWKGAWANPGPSGASNNGASDFSAGTSGITLYPSTGNTAQTTAVGIADGVVSEGSMANTFQSIRRYFWGNLSNWSGGDPTLNRPCKCRFVWQQTAGSPVLVLTTQTIHGEADFASGRVDFDRTLATAGTSVGSLGVRYVDQAFPTLASAGAGNKREARWATTFADEAGKYFHSGGVLFWIDDGLPGLQYSWLANGGWSTTDHLSPTVDADGKYTDAQLDTWMVVNRYPNVVILTIGINTSTGEGSSSGGKAVYKANMMGIINRYRNRIQATGQVSRPLFLLVANWTVSSDQTGSDARADVLYQIAQENGDCGFLNMNQIMLDVDGAYSTWQGTYLADGIHQSAAGVTRFGQLVNKELLRAAYPISAASHSALALAG